MNIEHCHMRRERHRDNAIAIDIVVQSFGNMTNAIGVCGNTAIECLSKATNLWGKITQCSTEFLSIIYCT